MTIETENPPAVYDPGNMVGNVTLEPIKLVWYRRPWVLASAAVAIVVLASVAVDLPQHTSVAQDAGDQTKLINEINGDLAPCAYGVSEVFTLYGEMKAGTLTPSDRVRVPALLRDDQTACSFTSGPIFNLSSIQTSGTQAGQKIGAFDNQATLWATSDALAAIEDIQNIYSGTNTTKASRDLVKQQQLLASDRTKAADDIQAAESMLGGAHLPGPALPALPNLSRTN